MGACTNALPIPEYATTSRIFDPKTLKSTLNFHMRRVLDAQPPFSSHITRSSGIATGQHNHYQQTLATVTETP